MKKIILIAGLIALSFSFEFREAFINFNKGVRFIKKGDSQKAQKYFAQAYAILHNLESKNQASSQVYERLGRMYANGWGVDKNLKKAQDYLQKAIQMGNRRAHCFLAKVYIQMGKLQEAKKELKYSLSQPTVKQYCKDINPNTLKIKGE